MECWRNWVCTTVIEIEVKLKVDAHEPVRSRLASIGAHRIDRVLEVNHIFDWPDRSLLGADQGLRVRALRSLDEGESPPATLTFKGPRRLSNLKTRPELEVAIADAEPMIAILEALGFERVLLFEKRRERWRFGNCLVDLDDLPHLGTFVEIEGPDEAAVRQTRIAVKLDGAAEVASPYIALLIEAGEAIGSLQNEIRFSDETR